MTFHRNAWYVAALPQDVGRELRRRTILGDPILLYRKLDGSLAAVMDRCPHRFAPLSRGTLHDDIIECKYHGLRFDGSGMCVLNPHGETINPAMHVHHYPAVECHGLVWIWMGNPETASLDRIPNLSYMGASGSRTVRNYIYADYRYDILVDNLLDVSHVDYLHVGSLSSGPPERGEVQVRQQGDDVFVVRTLYNSPTPPRIRDWADRIDQRFVAHWHPGQVIDFEWRGALVGQDLASGRLLARFSHYVTPETDGSTHYFMSATRYEGLDDPTLEAQVARSQVAVVQNEDGPMLEAVNAEMHGADLVDLRPVVLPTDKGAMQVRRVMKRLLRQEAEEAAARNSVRQSSPALVASE